MSKVEIEIKVTTNREKAVAASEIGNHLVYTGTDRSVASDIAIHELKHALSDVGGEGVIGVEKYYFLRRAYYATEKPPSRARRRQILKAVGWENMSIFDKLDYIIGK